MRILPFFLVLLASTPAPAQSPDVESYCYVIGRFARTIMENRQKGATELEMLSSAAPSPEFQELGQTLIAAAFAEPVAPSEELKQRAINAFERATTAACVEAGGD